MKEFEERPVLWIIFSCFFLIYHQNGIQTKRKSNLWFMYVVKKKKDVGNHGNSQEKTKCIEIVWPFCFYIRHDDIWFFSVFWQHLFSSFYRLNSQNKNLERVAVCVRWIASCFDLWKPEKKKIDSCTTKQFCFLLFLFFSFIFGWILTWRHQQLL